MEAFTSVCFNGTGTFSWLVGSRVISVPLPGSVSSFPPSEAVSDAIALRSSGRSITHSSSSRGGSDVGATRSAGVHTRRLSGGSVVGCPAVTFGGSGFAGDEESSIGPLGWPRVRLANLGDSGASRYTAGRVLSSINCQEKSRSYSGLLPGRPRAACRRSWRSAHPLKAAAPATRPASKRTGAQTVQPHSGQTSFGSWDAPSGIRAFLRRIRSRCGPVLSCYDKPAGVPPVNHGRDAHATSFISHSVIPSFDNLS